MSKLNTNNYSVFGNKRLGKFLLLLKYKKDDYTASNVTVIVIYNIHVKQSLHCTPLVA